MTAPQRLITLELVGGHSKPTGRTLNFCSKAKALVKSRASCRSGEGLVSDDLLIGHLSRSEDVKFCYVKNSDK